MPVRIQAHSGSCRCPTDSKKDAPRCHSDGTLFFARPKQNVGLGPGVSGRPSQLAWYSRVISPSTGISPEFYTRPALIYSLGQLSHFLRNSLLSPPSLGRRGRRHLFALPIERERGEGAQSGGAAGQMSIPLHRQAAIAVVPIQTDRRSIGEGTIPLSFPYLGDSTLSPSRSRSNSSSSSDPTSEETNLSPLVRMGYIHGPKLHSHTSVVRAAKSE